MSIEVGVDLSVELGKLRDEIRKTGRRADERAKAMVPQDVKFQAAGVCPTPTAPFVLNLSGPDAGYYWLVRRLIVGGLTWATTAAGTAEVYVTGMNTLSGSTGGIAAARTVTDMIDQSATLPNKGFYGNHEHVVQANETLSIVIVTGTAGQTYTAAAGVQVFRTLPAGLEVDA